MASILSCFCPLRQWRNGSSSRAKGCVVGLRCKLCKHIGHLARACTERKKQSPRQVWKVKISTDTVKANSPDSRALFTPAASPFTATSQPPSLDPHSVLSSSREKPLMVGIEVAENVQHDGTEAWNEECDQVEKAAENLIKGINAVSMYFVRAGGPNSETWVEMSHAAVFFSLLYRSILRPRITEAPTVGIDLNLLARSLCEAATVNFYVSALSAPIIPLVPFTEFSTGTFSVPKKSWEQAIARITESEDSAASEEQVEVVFLSETNEIGELEAEENNVALTESNAALPINVPARQKKKSKPETAVVVTGFRRGLRSDKDCYIPMELPSGSSRRKKSSVAMAPTLEILQVKAMQKMGAELCGLDPEELTVEKLMQDPGAGGSKASAGPSGRIV